MNREIFLGFVRIHVLHHAAEQPVYGLWLIEELGRHGYGLGPGTLYPILRDLTDGRYLRPEKRIVDGRVRKYYSATARGRQALAAARVQIMELVAEVMGPEGGRVSRDRSASRPKPTRPRARRRPRVAQR